MNDRIFTALQQAGLSTSPQATLDHESAFFALYENELVYMDGAQPAGRSLSRVPLTEVTRIHSDRDGVLRVETATETSVTASLMGYNPNRVQRFFQQVRDTTARAKQLPVMPMNEAAPVPAQSPAQSQTPAQPSGQASTPTPAQTPASSPSPFAAPAAPMPNFNPLRDQQAGAGTPPARGPETPAESGPRPAPLVISSTPSLPPEPAPRRGSRPNVTPVGASGPAPAQSAATSAGSLPASSAAAKTGLPDPVPAAPNLSQPSLGQSGLSPLGSNIIAERAGSVQGLSGPLRFLAVVLGLAALALAYFQWRGGATLQAIWTVLTGGVSLVALLAFAAMLTLMADLARELTRRS